MVKLRIMLTPDPECGFVDDEDPLTALGSFLPGMSLDKLSTRRKVARGDMSTVGQRSLFMSQLDPSTPAQARLHEKKPGLIGPAQVSGRTVLSWEEEFANDVAYIDDHSQVEDRDDYRHGATDPATQQDLGVGLRQDARVHAMYIVKDLLIIGASGFGRETADVVEAITRRIGDPNSAVRTAGVDNQATRAMASVARTNLLREVREAGAVSCVVHKVVPQIYPVASHATLASHSRVEVRDQAFSAPETISATSAPIHVVMVETISQPYMQHHALLDSRTTLGERAAATRAPFVGDSWLRADLHQSAGAPSLDVTLLSEFDSLEEVCAVLDTADVLAMPSRSEAFPRELTEAIARVLSAGDAEVGGGISQLLALTSLVSSSQPIALAEAIRQHLEAREFRRQQAAPIHYVSRHYNQAQLAQDGQAPIQPCVLRSNETVKKRRNNDRHILRRQRRGARPSHQCPRRQVVLGRQHARGHQE